jgi:hypothetical protein
MINKVKRKRILSIAGLLLMGVMATTAQAASSTATLNNQFSDSGDPLNVHDGATSFSAFNESRSVDRLEASIRKSVVGVPDPHSYFRIFAPGTGVTTSVSLDPSTYYAYAYSPSKIYAKVSISE